MAAKKSPPSTRSSKNAPGRGRRRPEAAAPDPVYVPVWLPWLVYAVLVVVLFRAFVFSDAMLVGGDTLSLGYVARAFYADALKELGTFPLWAPLILGGTPFIDALSGGDSLYPPSLALLWVMDTHRALGWKLVLHIFAAGLFMFLWARTLGVSRGAALVAGTAYLLAPMLVGFVTPGHDGKLFVMSLAPLMFWAVERFFVAPRAATFAAVALVVALVISTTHFQMAWFLFMAVGTYAFFRAVQVARGRGGPVDTQARNRPGEAEAGDRPGNAEAGDRPGAAPRPTPPLRAAGLRFGLFLVAAVAGAAAAGVQLLPAVQYVTEYSRRVQTTRTEAGETGTAWSSSWSIHPEEAMSLLIPQFAGNNAGGAPWAEGTYWGRNGFKDNHENAGLLALLLAAVAFVGAPRKGVRLFMGGLGLVAFLFALGAHTPVWRIFYEVVPGIRLFRAPSQAMFLFVFATVTLAALGTERLLTAARAPEREARWNALLRVLVGGTALMGLLTLLAASGALTGFWTSAFWPGQDPMRLQQLEALRPYITQGAFVGLLLTGGVLALAWMARRAGVGPRALVAGLVVLVAVDGLRVDGTFIETMDFYEWATPDPLVRTILDAERGDGEPFRLASFARRGQDVTPALHGIELATGHHPNDLSRYRELIGMVGSGEPANLGHPNVRKILNVEYLLWPDAEQGRSLGGQPLARTQYGGGQPYQSLYADIGLPRARLVGSAVVKSDEEAVGYILSDAHVPEEEVVLAEAPPAALAGGPVSGSVRWVARAPNRVELAVQTDGPALLVVADNWYPAWKATVDGAEAPVLRAYHTLRAVPVPAGASTVVMEYDDPTLARSGALSGFLLLLLGGLALSGVVRRGGGAVAGGREGEGQERPGGTGEEAH